MCSSIPPICQYTDLKWCCTERTGEQILAKVLTSGTRKKSQLYQWWWWFYQRTRRNSVHLHGLFFCRSSPMLINICNAYYSQYSRAIREKMGLIQTRVNRTMRSDSSLHRWKTRLLYWRLTDDCAGERQRHIHLKFHSSEQMRKWLQTNVSDRLDVHQTARLSSCIDYNRWMNETTYSCFTHICPLGSCVIEHGIPSSHSGRITDST